MKNLLFVSLLSLISITPTKDPYKANWGTYDLHGAVKELKDKHAQILVNQRGKDTSFFVDDDIFFDRGGNVQKIIHHKDAILNAVESYQYDDKGRLKKIVKTGLDGGISETRTFNYTGGDETYTMLVAYKDSHPKQKIDVSNGRDVGYEAYDKNGVKKDWTTFTFDADGRLIEQVGYYNQKFQFKNTYQYTGKGNDNIRNNFSQDNKLISVRKDYYDSLGHIIHVVVNTANSQASKEDFFQYDSHGNEVSTRETSQITLFSATTKTEYVYDKHGNWVKNHGVATSGNDKSESLALREISYY